MANDYKNFTTQIAKVVLEGVESKRTLSKNVNVQKLNGVFDPDSGEEFDFKRPIRVKAIRTSDGDLTSKTASDIITGRAKGKAQDYITTFVKITDVEQSLKAGNLKDTLEPMAEELVTELELSQAQFMLANSGLLSGTPGTAVTTWKHVAGASSLLKATGVPKSSPWIAAVNSFAQMELAEVQRSLGAGGMAGKLISDAHKNSIISDNFGGMKVMTSDSLASYTTHTATRAGTITSLDVTYNTARDTMTQAITVAGFGANLQIRVGESLQITGRNRINLSTRNVIIDGTGAAIKYSGTVTTAVTLSATGTGIIIITGPAIFETAAGLGSYNTVDSLPAASDVITLLGAASTLIQPNLFWQRDAFSIGSVPMSTLDATDTMATTKDGLQIRITRFSDGIKNQNIIRMDMRVAFAALNPFFAGHLFG